ncbi:hypothetical protein PTSG_12233 [Salpingoeca rosetta]|uniref:Glutathione peroxidase n=1 Tax=Salpingoeca rosetta (strain ATCC 50818 / BSB-021) TaxID=946362 RepID=F2U950_SALR5|nr:uncharacterized protein PTSG_12233 [Salpingoeca rosetta]EGD73253.1 hypothetical protein PTSG_12233 [Salpingoeca rosetta]|eukprot:XP_004994284.1 hypothetical protein PTSG_12233 [Salpingoeca rosetta]
MTVMTRSLLVGVVLCAVCVVANGGEAAPAVRSIHELHARDIGGKDVALSKYAGRVLLIANVASECGYTDSGYDDLNALHERFHASGLQILAFPCNQFGAQEPGTNTQVLRFAHKKGAKFQLMDKINVNPPDQHPVYAYLTAQGRDQGPVQWNFEYFLVDAEGHVIRRYRTGTPLTSERAVEQIAAALEDARVYRAERRKQQEQRLQHKWRRPGDTGHHQEL